MRFGLTINQVVAYILTILGQYTISIYKLSSHQGFKVKRWNYSL